MTDTTHEAPERIWLTRDETYWQNDLGIVFTFQVGSHDVEYVPVDRIKELEERLKATTNDAKEAEAYAQEIYAHAKELEAKLKKGVLVEYDNDDVVYLSSFAGGASEGGAWSTLTLMKEEANGDISFREYKAVKNWETTRAELTGGKDE